MPEDSPAAVIVAAVLASRRRTMFHAQRMRQSSIPQSPTRNSRRACKPSDKENDGACVYEGVADFSVPSKSLARRRFRLIQAKNRSTTQRRGSTVNPTWLGSLLTISTTIRVALATRSPL